ncbi:acyltransferase family protein [Rhizobium sp. ZK1]|uniref:acyltransferase family protein n=1 Tax=Rhizobium sp. ZK1 TaxID=3389872 RepID=UPI0039F71D00
MIKKSEIRALTGFRGIAALVVASYHFARGLGENSFFVVSSGYIAVDAFFVLSGYVLAYNYAETFADRFDRNDYRDFLIRRICRIYPAYLGILALATVKVSANLGGGGPPMVLDAWDAFCNIFMLTGWGLHATPIIGVSWSVSAELFCYLLFPLFALLTKGNVTLLWAVAVAFFGGIVCLARLGLGVQGPMDIVSPDHSYSLLRAACGFGLGVIGYSIAVRTALGDQGVVTRLLPVCICILAVSWYFDETDLIKYALLVCLVWLIAQGSRIGEGIFGNRIVYFVGEVSYSLYLIHPLLISFSVKLAKRLFLLIGSEVAFVLALLAYLLLTIALSYVSYRAFELKGKNLMLKFLLPRRRPAI